MFLTSFNEYMTWSPDAVIWATVRRYKDIASIWRCPHSLSPTTGRPVFEENLAWIESTGEFVSLNFSTYIILIIIKSYIPIVMIKFYVFIFILILFLSTLSLWRIIHIKSPLMHFTDAFASSWAFALSSS